MKFIHTLWGARRREQERINPAFQERAAWYTLHPARNVQATPIRPPVQEKPRA